MGRGSTVNGPVDDDTNSVALNVSRVPLSLAGTVTDRGALSHIRNGCDHPTRWQPAPSTSLTGSAVSGVALTARRATPSARWAAFTSAGGFTLTNGAALTIGGAVSAGAAPGRASRITDNAPSFGAGLGL